MLSLSSSTISQGKPRIHPRLRTFKTRLSAIGHKSPTHMYGLASVDAPISPNNSAEVEELINILREVVPTLTSSWH